MSGVLQFLVLPFLSQFLHPRIFWILMPLCMLCLSLLAIADEEVSLDLVATIFCAMKIMEYAFRGLANEMVSTFFVAISAYALLDCIRILISLHFSTITGLLFARL